MFTASDYRTLHSLVFDPLYPGYTPKVVESPNGDGKLDDLKRYSHVAMKYLRKCDKEPRWDAGLTNLLRDYLYKAHQLALEVAISIGVPPEFWPHQEYSCLRVLEYGPNATSAPHKDFDLFTLSLYRNLPEFFKYVTDHNEVGYDAYASARQSRALKNAQKLNAQIHFGELLEEISADKTWKANKHEVVASGGPNQFSVVYFAVPSHEVVLTNGTTVGKWMEERKNRSRYEL